MNTRPYVSASEIIRSGRAIACGRAVKGIDTADRYTEWTWLWRYLGRYWLVPCGYCPKGKRHPRQVSYAEALIWLTTESYSIRRDRPYSLGEAVRLLADNRDTQDQPLII